MKIAIMGAGGVGSYIGARLAAAGLDPVLIARGAHLEAMRRHGLRLTSPAGDAVVPAIHATDDPGTVGPVDAVLLTVKLYDVEAACRLIRPMLGPATMVVPVQNGVWMPERLPALVGAERAVGGLVFIAATVSAPGEVRHLSAVHRLIVGELAGGPSPRLERLREAGAAAGFDVEVSDDIHRVLWEKFVFLAGVSAATCLSRQAIGVVRDDPALRGVFVSAMEELVALARAKGIALADDIVPRTLAFAGNFDPGSKPSMLEDLEAGKRLEVEWLSGAAARMGDELGIPTPVHHVAYACLKPFAGGR